MSNRAIALRKQALERWQYVPPAEQKQVLEELKAWPRGTAAIELSEPARAWPDNYSKVKATVVPLTFGTDTSQPNKRYLFLSDIPQPSEEKQ